MSNISKCYKSPKKWNDGSLNTFYSNFSEGSVICQVDEDK